MMIPYTQYTKKYGMMGLRGINLAGERERKAVATPSRKVGGCGQLWTGMGAVDRCGPVWAAVDSCGQLWTGMGNSGLRWSGVDHCEQQWVGVGRSG